MQSNICANDRRVCGDGLAQCTKHEFFSITNSSGARILLNPITNSFWDSASKGRDESAPLVGAFVRAGSSGMPVTISSNRTASKGKDGSSSVDPHAQTGFPESAAQIVLLGWHCWV